MRILVTEYFTSMDIGRSPDSPEHSMWVEGNAMREAIEADFRAISGVKVVTSPDESADWTFLIAPETDGVLARSASEGLINTPSLARRANKNKLLGPSPDVILLTSDKLRTYELWKSAGVPTPFTMLMDRNIDMSYPRIVKPRDGAGSMETYVVNDRQQYDELIKRSRHTPCGVSNKERHTECAYYGADTTTERHTECAYYDIVQPYCRGIPASVAFLCNGREFHPLLSCLQIISDDGRCHYLGGMAPLPGELSERAVAIARQALEAIPGDFRGYVGVDVLLGETDLAIEINPRLTTSYLGLRQLAEDNIAEAMLRLASGESIEKLRWRSGILRWYPEGRTEWVTETELAKLIPEFSSFL